LFKYANSSIIESEEIVIDLGETSKVKINISYAELTTEKISYLIPYKVLSWTAISENEKLNCKILELKVGEELICEPKKFNNFSVLIEFVVQGLSEKKEEGIYRVQYEKNVLEPTRKFRMKIVLPEGYGIFSGGNDTTGIEIRPKNYVFGTTGRRISVSWNIEEVNLGESLIFSAFYENLGKATSLDFLIPSLIVLSLVVLGIFEIYLGGKRKFERIIENLKDDERKIYLYIKEKKDRKEKCTQRDIVKDLNMSKAKVSRLLHDMQERNLVVLTKKGRKNVVELK
jgi:uncharacterized membrane protein